MNTPHHPFLLEAVTLSAQAIKENHGGPFGAVIVQNGVIVGRGFNRVTSTNDPTAHAEVNAIRDACKNLNTFQLDDCVIYTSCEPCPMCLGAIYWARLKTIYFANSRTDAANIGFDDSFIYDQIGLPLDARSIPSVYIEIPEAKIPFQTWKNLDSKKEY